jgi:hypothetical protein
LEDKSYVELKSMYELKIWQKVKNLKKSDLIEKLR